MTFTEGPVRDLTATVTDASTGYVQITPVDELIDRDDLVTKLLGSVKAKLPVTAITCPGNQASVGGKGTFTCTAQLDGVARPLEIELVPGDIHWKRSPSSAPTPVGRARRRRHRRAGSAGPGSASRRCRCPAAPAP
ncbi:MAG: hypothetical protein R2939_06015 [Kofleriaceae bacterium]